MSCCVALSNLRNHLEAKELNGDPVDDYVRYCVSSTERGLEWHLGLLTDCLS
jgi:hypothetical protein